MTLAPPPPARPSKRSARLPAAQLTVSDRLVEPLRIVATRAKMLAWLHAIFKLFALIAAIWLVEALLMGSRLQVPFWLALPLTIAGWVVVIYGGYRIFRTLHRRKRGMASAALLVDDAMPDSQERISSAIELAHEANPDFRGSPELVAVLMRQAEHHADSMDPTTVISGKDVMRWLSAAVVIVLVWFVLLIVLTPNMLLGMQRMIAPWKADAAPPEPILDVDPGDVILAQGSDLEIKVKVKPPEGLSFDNGNGKINSTLLVQHFIASGHGGGTAPDITTAMEPTLNAQTREFRLNFQNIQQAFTYKIIADGGKDIGRGESQEFTVTVQTKPAVADVEAIYTYPAYTGLNPRTDHSHDGVIAALVGTKMHVVIHTTEPVKTAQMTLADDGNGIPKTMDLTFVPTPPEAAGNGAGEAAYATDFTINKTTTYAVKLVKEDGRENPDNSPRAIKALVDNPPAIGIVLPDPKGGALKVRPDDTVPMKIIATDDFGVDKVEALVKVDNRPEVTINVPIPSGDARITADWNLPLPYLLNTLTHPAGGNAAEPKSISYQFRATDTRDPNPQTALSTRQSLNLDKNSAPLAQRLDTQAAKDLASAVKKAVDDLKSAQSKLESLGKNDKDRVLSDKNKQALADTQKDLQEAGQLLRQGADQAETSRLGEVAKQARDVADGPVKTAEADAVEAGLASDQSPARLDSEAGALRNTQEALDKLTKLQDALKNATHDQPLAQALERLAKEQQDLADALAKNPNDPALLAKQQELQAELDKLIHDNPQLQQPAADANQAHFDDLVHKVQNLEKEQQAINQQVNNVNDADKSADKAAELAKKQDALN
ncbi:MAG TPA: hypothetical protein VGN88_03480, partial [Phycisphaerae bacterium]